MKRLVLSALVATAGTIYGFNALGLFAQATPLKTIATVVAHGHHRVAASALHCATIY